MSERTTLYRKNETTGVVDECHCAPHQRAQLENDGWTTDTSGKKVLSDGGKKSADAGK